MPLVLSAYHPPLLFKSGHFSTLYCGVLRSVKNLEQVRERILLKDNDFIDVDWSYANPASAKVVLVLHGLEGSAQRAYVRGSAKQLNHHGFDVCAINLRGCSGTVNKLFRSYHSGATEDLAEIVAHVTALNKYTELFLHGFSLGGNLLLKYLGEDRKIPKEIKGAVAISVPCQLADSLHQLLQLKNAAYAFKFKKTLLKKLRMKQAAFPEAISSTEINSIKTLKDFDDVYTSKAHGFKNAFDYYTQCSCRQFLSAIKVPTLIINAKNDSFLGDECYPYKEAKNSAFLYLETPTYGGHVGFYGPKNNTYTEQRTVAFLSGL